ncbi:MAG: chemotaxis-specific protein-glutamate methyltransferase CheB [Myxococcota bacterium]
MIRTLVAEDSLTTRELLVAVLRSDPQVDVVGEAANGVEALEMTRKLRPDVVTMDIRMPLLDGFEATRQIMVEAPTPIVIVSASIDVRDVEVSMHALRAGALALLPTPSGPGSPAFEEQAKHFLETVKLMSQVKVVRRWPRHRASASAPSPVPAGARPQVVAVGASTGGPAALARIISELPGDFPVPLLAVQHIARGFMDGFAAWLNAAGALKVKIGEDGEPLQPRTVYLAPDDAHLGVSPDRVSITVSRAASVGGFRPSASYLFASVARAFGPSAVAVILTGMGNDGIEGLRAVHAGGGRVLAQDEETSVVFGMPGAAAAAGVVDVVLPLGAIAFRLLELVGRGGPHA